MGFLDFILDNLFIVIIIVAGLINFFGRSGKKEKQADKRDSRQGHSERMERRRESVPKTFEKKLETMAQQAEKKFEDAVSQFEGRAAQQRKTAAEQHQQQLERLKEGIQSRYGQEDEEDTHTGMETFKRTPNTLVRSKSKAPQVKVNVAKQLTTRGLMESVIMAEVLGPPRARNPYQNVAVKRMRR